ncbi:MAG: ferrichrome transporter substrate-binding protein, partial [Paenibacillus sp.]|nr:ferrichrome transporter substrate-binding protein [Paenibacillus sp.]
TTSEASRQTGGKAEQAQAPEAKRSFKHPFGTTEVPASPKRIVGIYLDDFLLTLGVKPVTQTMYGKRSLPYLQDKIGDLPPISTGSINLELIVQQSPDLILLAYPAYAQDGKYDQFAKIAPTYVFTGEEGWRNTLRIVADVIGKPKEAETWLNEYERKIAAARESLNKKMGDETVMFIRFTRAERIQIYGGPSNFAADVIYQDLGLKPSELVKKLAWSNDNSAPLISAEIISQFDADHIFITYDNPDNEDALEFKNHPLWKNIPAVKKGNLHTVEMFHWMNDGPLATSKKVDDVLKALLK